MGNYSMVDSNRYDIDNDKGIAFSGSLTEYCSML